MSEDKIKKTNQPVIRTLFMEAKLKKEISDRFDAVYYESPS